MTRTTTVAGFTVHYSHAEELAVLNDEIFEHEEYRFDCLRAAPRILDCGAHIGLSVLYFKRRFPRARITAFEANPDTFALLTRNVCGNGFTDVELVNAAVAEQAGTVEFYVARDPSFWHWGDAAVKNMWFSNEVFRTIRVRSVALAAYLTERIDYLKMDIEGLETRVLRAVTRQLPQVDRMAVEFHGSYTNPDNQLGLVRGMLRDAGLASVLRQAHWWTRETHLQCTEPYTVMISAYRSRLALVWSLRADILQRLRMKCGLGS